MNKVGRLIGRYDWQRLFKRHWLVIVVALFLSWAYMGQSLTGCRTTVIGSIGGDNIDGIIWLFSNTAHPYGGFSHVTNYPFGESLSQPQLITSAALMVPTWLLAKIIGPVCAWNAMVFFGYMSSALLMYGFVYWLLQRRGIALFAAIAVGFSPYHYWKTWGHLAYIQSELFVGLLWAWLSFWKNPSKFKAVILGILVAGLFYSDGYFPLLGGAALFGLLGYAFVADYYLTRGNNTARRLYFHKLSYLLISLVVVAAALLPVIYVKERYAARISANLVHARSDPKIEVETYGARFIDFILPSETSPITPIRHSVNHYRGKHVYSVNGEYTLYLGFVSLALALTAIGITSYKLLSKPRRLLSREKWLMWVSASAFVIALVSFIFSLAPSMAVFGFHPQWPSAYISGQLSYWRVFARFYLVLNVAVVTLASIGLWWILKYMPKPKARLIILAIVLLLTITELMPVNPFRRHDEWKVTSGSPTYTWLNKLPVKAVAAYPLVEAPFNSSYFGDQLVHKKALLNSYSVNDTQLLLHRSLTGINDQQTLGVLKTLGINNLLLYRVRLPKNDSQKLTVIYGNYGARVAAISSSVIPLKHVLVPDQGYAVPVVDPATQISCRQQIGTIGALSVRPLQKGYSKDLIPVHFELRGQPHQSVIIYSKGAVLDSYAFSGKNETHGVDLTVPEDAAIYIGHISDSSKGFISVCNLGVGD